MPANPKINPKIILASSSPRRTQILSQADIPHEIVVSGADENVQGPVDSQVKELSLRKAKAALAILPPHQKDHIIIAADTLVAIDDKVLAKPETEIEAFDMLSSLSGNTHQVHTGVTIMQGGSVHTFADTAHVTFRIIGEGEIMSYIASGAPLDKAGGYGIQDKGAIFVEKIDGDFYTVMGLPISKVCLSLATFGYNCWG